MPPQSDKLTSVWLSRLGLIGAGLGLMTRREAIGMIGIIVLMMVSGLLESAVVALVFPLVYVIVDPVKFEATAFGSHLSTFTGGQPVSAIFGYLAISLIVLVLLGAAVSSLTLLTSERHGARCRIRFAHDLLMRTVSAPYLWQIQNNTALIARRFYEDVRVWRRDFIQSLLAILQSTIMIIAPSSVAIAIAPSDGLIALLIVALVCGLVIVSLRRKLKKNSLAVQASSGATIKTLLQILSGMREVIVSSHAGYFIAGFDRHHRDLNRSITSGMMWGNAPAQIINLLGQVGFVSTAALLWWRGVSGTEIAAQLALIGIVVSRVVPAFSRLASNLSILMRAAPIVETIIDFRKGMDRAQQEFGRKASNVPVPSHWTTLALKDVSFRYPGTERLSVDGVSIELARGKSYGFVGRSGAGKSTLVNLLLGLVEPTSGSVSVDGTALSELSITDWYRRIGYVPQDPLIFDSSLRDNIVFGEAVDDAQVMRSVELASLTKVVAALPNGLSAMLGERGRRFSGGQAPRVALARALFKRPDMLILDEATSALDSITEAEIYSAIGAEKCDVTTLIVAHRVASLRNCDLIFLLDHGKVIDSGSFDDLLDRSGLFRGLAAEEDNVEKVTV